MVEVNVSGVKLEFVKGLSYLGITIDNKLCSHCINNCYNGAIIWNNLPGYIRSLKEINEFKSEIKKYYFGMFLSDNDRE